MGAIEWKTELFSNPKKGKRVFDALVQMLQTQQSQLETLADECRSIGERVQVQHGRWISDVRLLEHQIDQMRSQMKSSEIASFVEATKTNLVLGLKKKKDSVYKLKLERSEDELADFKEWFEILSHRCPIEKDVGPENGSSPAASMKKADREHLEDEVKRLKREYEKLSMKNSSEASELMSETEFAWNQFREMESKYTTQLQVKNDEVKEANAKVSKLLETVEELQSSSKEKDSQIADLEAKLAKIQAETSGRNKSIKKSKNDSLIPVLRHCSGKPKAKALSSDDKHGSTTPVPRCGAAEQKYKSLKRSKNGSLTSVSRCHSSERKAKALSSDDKHGSTTPVLRCRTAEQKDKTSGSDDKHGSRKTTIIMKRKMSSSKDSRSEKRKRAAFMEETPKLFTSNFKIPKLKSSSIR